MRSLLVPVAVGAALLAACGDEGASVRTGGSVPAPDTTVEPLADVPVDTSEVTATTATVVSSSIIASRMPSTTARPKSAPAVKPPSSPVSTTVANSPPLPPPALNEPTPTRVEPLARAVDLRPRTFERAVPLGEQTLSIRFWGGVAPCDVVGRVDVAASDAEVRVTLYTGRDPEPGDVACIELAVYKEVVVELGSPLAGRRIVDGAA